MQILTWFVLAYGFTNIMVFGSIFADMRNKIAAIGEDILNPIHPIFKFISGILSCMMCCSTWVGFFLGLFSISPMYLDCSLFVSQNDEFKFDMSLMCWNKNDEVKSLIYVGKNK